jgi:hypothetical protein
MGQWEKLTFAYDADGSIGSDPIFEAIERHRGAFGYVEDALKVFGPMLPDDPGYAEAQAEIERRCEIADEAAMEIANTAPETKAGVLALIDYVRDKSDWPELEDSFCPGAFYRAVMGTIADWLRRHAA